MERKVPNNLTNMRNLFVPLPSLGERIVIHNWEFLEVLVSKIDWISNENRFRIQLNWGKYGTSHVYPHDEGVVWRRHLAIN